MSEEATAEKKKKSGAGKLIVFALIGVLALAGAGAGGYFFFAAKHSDAEQSADAEEGDEETDEEADAEEGDEEAPAKKAKKGKKSKKPSAPAVYVKLDPALVVNFQADGAMRFLQVGVDMSTRDPLVAEELKMHEPAIRNDLLLLLSNQTYEGLSSREGKDKLRADALETVRTILDNEGGQGKKVEAIYFTSFVMQ